MKKEWRVIGLIKNVTDKVEVIALDRKNKELERATVTIEEKLIL
ncbi:hypothetical protein [Enterococcus plantarum]|nr:hypothetical protein [Enterococcus plantarum]